VPKACCWRISGKIDRVTVYCSVARRDDDPDLAVVPILSALTAGFRISVSNVQAMLALTPSSANLASPAAAWLVVAMASTFHRGRLADRPFHRLRRLPDGRRPPFRKPCSRRSCGSPENASLAMAPMGKPEMKISDLCNELGISSWTLYRYVSLPANFARMVEELFDRE
jgi:hypothetical protein